MTTHISFYIITMSPIFGFIFGWIPYLSVPESVYYLSIKYGLDHFYNLFYFRIELVLKSMHYLAVSSHFRWQDLTRWILNNSGQPSVDHHGPFGVSSGLILKYWRFEFLWSKAFFAKGTTVFSLESSAHFWLPLKWKDHIPIFFFNRDKILV